jgi:hypothetical protein
MSGGVCASRAARCPVNGRLDPRAREKGFPLHSLMPAYDSERGRVSVSHYLLEVLTIRHCRSRVVAIGALLAVVFTARTTLAATAFGCETGDIAAGASMAMDTPMSDTDALAGTSEPCDAPSLPTDCEALAPCAVAVAAPSDESFTIVTAVRRDQSSERFDAPASRPVRPALPPPRA